MSELSAAEKRRLLREKRAAKLSQGGDRINKILGTDNVNNTSINTTTGIEKNETKSNNNKVNNRISTILQDNKIEIEDTIEYDDPPVSGLGDESLESDSPLNEFISNDEIEKALNKMLLNSSNDENHIGHNHNKPIDDPFATMFKNMENMKGMSGLGGGDMSGMNFGNNIKSEYDILKSKFYQSTYVIIRFIIIFTMMIKNEFFKSISSWNKFLILEILFGIIQLICCINGIFPNNTIMSFDITSFGQINSIINGYAVARSFYHDFCLYILVFVYLNKL